MKILHIISATFLLIACSTEPGIPRGFKKLNSGIIFRLHRIGEKGVKPAEGDLVTISISYSTLNDSVFFSGSRKIKLEDPNFNPSVFDCIRLLSEGDSASFIFTFPDFFIKNLSSPIPGFLADEKLIKVNIGLQNIQNSDSFVVEKEQFLAWGNKQQELQNDILKKFLMEERISVSPTPNGLYYILLKVGSGKIPEIGDLIKIHYTGRFLDGRFFDNTRKQGEPLEFIYGQEFMVIKGMEEAIGMMREGEKALIIVPSELAFGSSGAGEGIIPPYAALIYEIELIEVRKR